MRIAYLVPTIYGMGGTASAIATQANAMARFHEVEIYSVYRAVASGHYPLDAAVTVHDLVDTSGGTIVVAGVSGTPEGPDQDRLAALRGTPAVLIDPDWDPTLDALADLGLEAALPRVSADVLVTVTPALLALATQLVPPGTAIVHQEHRSSSQRTSGLEPLLAFAPRADLVALLTESMATWLRSTLEARPGAVVPEIVTVPNAIPAGFAPRTRPGGPLIVAAGRLTGEKQLPQLVSAFATIADRVPEWRLRILGEGPSRFEIMSTVRRLGLTERVELPGAVTDMAREWEGASIMALTSRAEGFPLVVQEAMATGVAVVSYDCPSGPREIVEDGVDGLLVAQDSEPALAAALLSLATDTALRDRLAAAAVRSAAAWDLDVVTERWRGIYERVAQRHGTPRGRAAARLLAAAPPAPRDTDTGASRPVAGVTPEQARAAALRAAVSVAAAVTEDWFVIPPHGREPVLVLPMSARRAFVDGLAAADLPSYLCLHDPQRLGWPGRRGTPADLVPTLRRGRTGVVLLEPWPRDETGASLVAGCGLRVELWEEGVEGDLHAADVARYGGRLPRGGATARVDLHGVRVHTYPEMVGPTAEECTFPVDVVVTGAGEGLRHALRGVHLFAPWARRVHVLLEGPTPSWLDTSHPGLTVVEHRDLLALPDLAEHLLHLDDCVHLGRPSRPEQWFAPAGSGALLLADKAPPEAERRQVAESWGRTPTRSALSGPRALRRTALERLAADHGAAAIWSPLAVHQALATGAGHAGDTRQVVRVEVDLGRVDVQRQLRGLLSREQDVVVLGGAQPGARPREVVDGFVRDLLDTYVPLPAPWEHA